MYPLWTIRNSQGTIRFPQKNRLWSWELTIYSKWSMLLWVSFICSEYLIEIDKKNYSHYVEKNFLATSAWWVNKKVSIPFHHILSPLIWSIEQYCQNKPMMTYTGTWKSVLILSHGVYTSRTLFLWTKNVSIWDVNPAAEQTPLIGLYLV